MAFTFHYNDGPKPEHFEPGPLQRQWAEALTSGEYKQAKHVLKSPAGFCCLGVVEDKLGLGFQSRCDETSRGFSYPTFDLAHTKDLPATTQKKLRLFTDMGNFHECVRYVRCEDTKQFGSLAGGNDLGLTFDEIAFLITNHAELLFHEPV